MTEECRQDIIEYLHKEGWGDYSNVFLDWLNYEISRGYFLDSERGKGKNLEYHFAGDKWKSFDRYLLEYIGSILRKHKITLVTIANGYTYSSNTWLYEDIKLQGF